MIWNRWHLYRSGNDGKAEREKKREQMWNGILGEGWDKERRKVKRKMIF